MLSHLPTWVPFLLAALLVIGLKQTRQRVVTYSRLIVMPLAMLGMSIWGLKATFGDNGLALVAWATGMAVSATFLASRGRLVVLEPAPGPGLIVVPGSWVPLSLIVGIFAVRFALGFIAATHGEWLHQTSFVMASSLALGGLSGGFSGRALGLFLALDRQARRPGRVCVPAPNLTA